MVHLLLKKILDPPLTVALWLVCSTLEKAVWVQALSWHKFVLCSWVRHFTLTVPLSTQVYKSMTVNLMLGGNPANQHPNQGELKYSCY